MRIVSVICGVIMLLTFHIKIKNDTNIYDCIIICIYFLSGISLIIIPIIYK